MPRQPGRRAVNDAGGGGAGGAGVAWLRDIEALRRIPQRYARAIDARDIDAVATLFDPDGRVDGTRGSASVPDYLDALRTPSVFAASMHVLGDPLIDLGPGADTARMDTYAVVYQFRPPDSSEEDMELGIRYVDELVRRNDGWLITHRASTTLWTATPWRASPRST